MKTDSDAWLRRLLPAQRFRSSCEEDGDAAAFLLSVLAETFGGNHDEAFWDKADAFFLEAVLTQVATRFTEVRDILRRVYTVYPERRSERGFADIMRLIQGNSSYKKESNIHLLSYLGMSVPTGAGDECWVRDKRWRGDAVLQLLDEMVCIREGMGETDSTAHMLRDHLALIRAGGERLEYSSFRAIDVIFLASLHWRDLYYRDCVYAALRDIALNCWENKGSVQGLRCAVIAAAAEWEDKGDRI